MTVSPVSMQQAFKNFLMVIAVVFFVNAADASGPNDAPLSSLIYQKAPNSPTDNQAEGTGFTITPSTEGYAVAMWVRVRHMFTPIPPGNQGTILEMYDTGTVSRTINIGHEYFPGDLKHYIVFRDNAVTMKLFNLPVPAPSNGNITNGDWHWLKVVVYDAGASTWYLRAYRNNVRDTTFDTDANGQLIPGGATFGPTINTIRYNNGAGTQPNYGFDTDEMVIIRVSGTSTVALFESHAEHDSWSTCGMCDIISYHRIETTNPSVITDYSGNSHDLAVVGVDPLNKLSDFAVIILMIPDPLSVTTTEDTDVTITCAGQTSGLLADLRCYITSLPLMGQLYDSPDGSTVGSLISAVPETTSGKWVIFRPGADESGAPYETFTYKLRDSPSGVISDTQATVTVNATSTNDAFSVNIIPHLEMLEDDPATDFALIPSIISDVDLSHESGINAEYDLVSISTSCPAVTCPSAGLGRVACELVPLCVFTAGSPDVCDTACNQWPPAVVTVTPDSQGITVTPNLDAFTWNWSLNVTYTVSARADGQQETGVVMVDIAPLNDNPHQFNISGIADGDGEIICLVGDDNYGQENDPLTFSVTTMPTYGTLFQVLPGDLKGPPILGATPGTPVTVTHPDNKIWVESGYGPGSMVGFNTADTNQYSPDARGPAFDSLEVMGQSWLNLTYHHGPECTVNTAVGFADFNTVKDATNDPSCTETGSSIVIDAVNNPFVEDDIIFGGVGPYDVYSFNGATIQGTGHRVTTNGGVTFSGLVFDGAGASATIMEGTNLQNATFLHCTFKEARVGLLAVSDSSYASPEISVQWCSFHNFTEHAFYASDFDRIVFDYNELVGVGENTDAVDVSMRTSSLLTFDFNENLLTNDPGFGLPSNRTAFYVHDIDTTLSRFSMRDNVANNIPVGIRLWNVPEPVVLNHLPPSWVVNIDDGRKALRELARQGNNWVVGSENDVVRGLAINDVSLLEINRCNGLCPAFAFNGTSVPGSGEVTVEYNTACDVKLTGSEQSLQLDGIDDCVIVDAEAAVPGNNNQQPLNSLSNTFTVELWIKADALSLSSTTRTLVTKGAFKLYVEDSVVKGQIITSSGTTILNTDTILTTVLDTHIGMTYDGTTLSIYHNTILTGSVPVIGGSLVSHSATQMRYGCSTLNTEYWAGTIDEVRVWNTARTPAQISEHWDVTQNGREEGLIHYYRFDREGWEPTGRILDTHHLGLGGTIIGNPQPNTAFVPGTTPLRKQYRFTYTQNFQEGLAHTLGFHPYEDIRHAGTCDNRSPMHDSSNVASVPWTDIWATNRFPYISGNHLKEPSEWWGQRGNIPLNVGMNFGAGLPADYKDSLIMHLDITLQDLLACRPNIFSSQPQGQPLTKSQVDPKTVEYIGRLYSTSTSSFNPVLESSGEIIRNRNSCGFRLVLWTDAGVTVAFTTHVFDYDIKVNSQHFDEDTCDLVINFDQSILHVDQLFFGHESSYLADCVIDDSTETGPRMGLTYNVTSCTDPTGTNVFSDTMTDLTVNTAWSAGTLEGVQCPNINEQALRLPSNVDTTLTVDTSDSHSKIRLFLSLIFVGPWTGDDAPGELLKISVDGVGDLVLSTISTDGSKPHSFPNPASGSSSLPTVLNTCGLPSDTSYHTLEFVGTTAINHDNSEFVLRIRTIDALPGAYVSVDNVVLHSYTDDETHCNGQWTMKTGAPQYPNDDWCQETQFLGSHTVSCQPFAWDQDAQLFQSRGERTRGTIHLDITRNRGPDDDDVTTHRNFTLTDPIFYRDGALTNIAQSYVFDETVYLWTQIEPTDGLPGQFDATIQTLHICPYEAEISDYDPENPSESGCFTPRVGAQVEQVYSSNPLDVFSFKNDFAAQILTYPPLLNSMEVGIQFQAQPVISSGRGLYADLRVRITPQLDYQFEHADNPMVILDEGTDISILPDKTMMTSVDGKIVVAFIDGLATYKVDAKTELTDVVYSSGPIHQLASGDIQSGTSNVVGDRLVLTSAESIVIASPLALNYALRFNTFLTSWFDATLVGSNFPLPVTQFTFSNRIKFESEPVGGGSPTDAKLITFSNAGISFETGLHILGRNLFCYWTRGAVDVRTHVDLDMILPVTIDYLHHVACRLTLYAGTVRMNIFIDGRAANNQVFDIAPLTPVVYELPAGTDLVITAGKEGPDLSVFDDIRVYRDLRTDEEILDSYHKIINDPIIAAATDKLVAYYRLDDIESSFVHDEAASNHGVLRNLDDDLAKRTRYEQHDMPSDPEAFYGYGLSTTQPEPSTDLIGNYALELKSGSATSASFTEFDDGTADFMLESFFRIPLGGLPSITGTITHLRIQDSTTDWTFVVEFTSVAMTARYTGPGGVVIAESVVSVLDIPLLDNPHMWHFAFGFSTVSPGVMGLIIYGDGLPLVTTTVTSTIIANVPAKPPGLVYTLHIEGSASQVIRTDEIRLWGSIRTPAEILEYAYKKVEHNQGDIKHCWCMQDVSLSDMVGTAALSISGQTVRVKQNMQPGFDGFDPWSNSQDIQFFIPLHFELRNRVASNRAKTRMHSRVSKLASRIGGKFHITSGFNKGTVATLGFSRQFRQSCQPGQVLDGNVCRLDDPISKSHNDDDDDDEDTSDMVLVGIGITIFVFALLCFLMLCFFGWMYPGRGMDYYDDEPRSNKRYHQRYSPWAWWPFFRGGTRERRPPKHEKRQQTQRGGQRYTTVPKRNQFSVTNTRFRPSGTHSIRLSGQKARKF